MRLVLVVLLASFTAACSNTSSCLPALPQTPSCDSEIFVDASTTDPLCLASEGLPLCRGDNAVCYVCTGGTFTDHCLIKDKTGATTECVHSCSQC